jgi:hypothetical protein
MDELKNRYRLFIKFLSSQYLNSFLIDGLIYMNPIKYFIDLEEKEFIGKKDQNEGLAASFLANQIIVKINNRELKDIVGRVDLRNDDDIFTNIFSLTAINDYHIYISNKKLFLSDKFIKMGDKAVVFYGKNIEEFVKRIKDVINLNKDIYSKITGKMIEYVDYNTHNGEMGIFKKYSNFEWQYEWRLAIKKNDQKLSPTILKIGDINNIVSVYDTKDLIKFPIEMTLNNS